MPSLYTLIADELGISDAQAKKLLAAMLKEIRKRAETGVRLPDLGKFKEVDGQLHFEPSESLARAVNHRFEGLDEEDLASAPVQDDEEEEKDQGPSTITLGYQDTDWSPLESSATETTSGDDADEDGADTAEFQVPDADEAADTEELQVDTEAPPPSTSAESSRNESSSPGSSSAEPHAEPDTEELHPLVEDDSDDPTDAPDPSSSSSETANTTSPTSEDEHDSLSGIWDSDDDEDLESSPAFDAESPSSVEPSDSAATDSFSFEEEQQDQEGAAHSDAPTAESPPSEDRSGSSPTRPGEKSTSSAPRIFVSVLVLLLLGGGAWYILGQRGLVPTPRTTFAPLSTMVQSLTAGASSSSTESPPSDTGTTASTDAPAEESTSQSGEVTAQSAGSSSSSDAPSTASADSIDPSAGGWSIIVASRADVEGAESLAQTYRDRFADRDVPVDVIEGTVNNSTRYRVGVGQFDSQSAAESFLQNFDSELPDGAWSLNLQ